MPLFSRGIDKVSRGDPLPGFELQAFNIVAPAANLGDLRSLPDIAPEG